MFRTKNYTKSLLSLLCLILLFYLCNIAKVIQEIMLKWSFYALCYLILIVTCTKQKRKSFCQRIILTSLHLFPRSILFCWKYKLRLIRIYKELTKNNFVLFQSTRANKEMLLDFLVWHATAMLSFFDSGVCIMTSQRLPEGVRFPSVGAADGSQLFLRRRWRVNFAISWWHLTSSFVAQQFI